MTAEEVRKCSAQIYQAVKEMPVEDQTHHWMGMQAQMLAEIAAQLAELNETLKVIEQSGQKPQYHMPQPISLRRSQIK